MSKKNTKQFEKRYNNKEKKHVPFVEQIFFEKFMLCGVNFEICIIKTNLTKDAILSFGDFQECCSTNNIIFDFAFDVISDLGYNFDNINSICSGDMFGETYFDDNGTRVLIKGSDGVPNYDLYNRTNSFYFVLGNHDICPQNLKKNNKTLPVHLDNFNDLISLKNNTTIAGTDGIFSLKNPNYLKKVQQKIDLFPDIIVTHDSIKTAELNKICQNKVDIHIFGHCHMRTPWMLMNSTLQINSDSRFVLILPL
jgi:predicted phosphodiesterase